MIYTILLLLGLIGLLNRLPIPTWVKWAVGGVLGLRLILNQLMSWAVRKGNLSTRFLLACLLSFVCWLLGIRTLVYPRLVEGRSSWAGHSQAFGWILAIPEASRREMCTMVSEESEAFSEGEELKTDIVDNVIIKREQLRRDRKLEYKIGFLVVTLELPPPDAAAETKLQVDATYRAPKFLRWNGITRQIASESFKGRDVSDDRIRILLTALEYWKLNPEMGIVRIGRRDWLLGVYTLRPHSVSGLLNGILKRGLRVRMLPSEYREPGCVPKFVF